MSPGGIYGRENAVGNGKPGFHVSSIRELSSLPWPLDGPVPEASPFNYPTLNSLSG